MPTDDGDGEPVDEIDEIDEEDEADEEVQDDQARDWRDEYIDDQLAEHRADEPIGPGPEPMSRFRHGSLGVTLGAAMTGLGNVLEPRKKEEAAVIVEHDEPDHSRDPIELRLDTDDPASSVVIIRKWQAEHKPSVDDNEEGPA